jgi:hypothetical protein
MTSPDGITWTTQTSAADNEWRSVTWAPELSIFVAVAGSGTGNRVMTSPDGITWTARTSATDNLWLSVTWAPELSIFAAVAYTGSGTRVMTSTIGMPNSKSVVKALPSQMTVLPNGNVGIGTTIPTNLLTLYNSGYQIAFTAPSQRFDVGVNSADRAFYVSSLSGYFGVYITQNGSAWSGYSDERIKKNIEPIQNALSKVLQLEPVRFHWMGTDDNDNKDYGLIAQSVAKIFPDIVETTSGTKEIPNMKGLSYTKFIPLLIQCIKEQQSQIDELRQQIAIINH